MRLFASFFILEFHSSRQLIFVKASCLTTNYQLPSLGDKPGKGVTMTEATNNAKGKKGYIVGYWNTHRWETSMPRDGKVTLYIQSVEVMSCGKKQMTLMEVTDGEMSRSFHNPSRPVHLTIDDAKAACVELFNTFVVDSVRLSKKYNETRGQYNDQYDWWPADKAKRQEYIEILEGGKMEFDIVIR